MSKTLSRCRAEYFSARASKKVAHDAWDGLYDNDSEAYIDSLVRECAAANDLIEALETQIELLIEKALGATNGADLNPNINGF